MLEDLKRRRLESWKMDGKQNVPDPAAAKAYIDRLGVVTLFHASPEVPNLYDAHMGVPNAPTSSKHDSPSGYVYSWRWDLGKAEAAFYGTLVNRRPTWVAWEVLPSVLGAFMEFRHPEELHELGLLSNEALRVASALEEAGREMSTDELRKAADFPTGKAQRAAFLKAVDELTNRLIVAKPFRPDGEMAHVLVDLRYREAAEAARRMDPKDALASLVERLLPGYVYMSPKPLARALRIPEESLVCALRQCDAQKVAGAIPLLFIPK